jgi:hypothetical protein
MYAASADAALRLQPIERRVPEALLLLTRCGSDGRSARMAGLDRERLTAIDAAVVSNRSGHQKCPRVYICSLFVPHAKTTELIQPCEGAFHNPSASLPTRCHAVCYALQARAGCGGHAWCDGCFSNRKLWSPSTELGQRRGLPRVPCSGGIPSGNAKAGEESWQLAPIVLMANGMQRAVADQVALFATFSSIRWIRSC